MIRGSFGLSALIFVGALTMAVTSQPSAAADNSARRVRNVVLVHGAWADGSSWAKVIPLLEKAGLNAVAVQNPLTSLADDVATTKGVLENFAQDLPMAERKLLAATQGPTNGAAFGAKLTNAAWKTKPTWYVVAANDR